VARLCRHVDEVALLHTQVLVISFGTEPWARAWLRETGSPFPLLLDPDRRVYRAYGLGRSALRTWTPRVVWYYVGQLATGRRLRPVQGDPYQLGGDFIVDAGGIVRLAHSSRDPVDRPPIARLLEALRVLQRGERRQEPPRPPHG
jgi:alkyl hydroperoxide reductase subunit AhpC